MSEMLNPLAKLTPVPMGKEGDLPSLLNTKSSPTLANHIDTDLEYIRSLGPLQGGMPWEKREIAENPIRTKPNPHMTGPE